MGRARTCARVLADSVNPWGGRITTVEVTFWRPLNGEMNTHRKFSRNSASSRAIPLSRTLRAVLSDPAGPVRWGRNQAGMQARVDLSGVRRWVAMRLFYLARWPVVILAWILGKVGLHKQIINRMVEPWLWHTAIITATDWDNFFKLRLHDDAEPSIQEAARCIKAAIDESVPRQLQWGEWHLPLVTEEDFGVSVCHGGDELRQQAMLSAARCARVSYLRHLERRTWDKDIEMSRRLIESGHWSPFEHQAQAHWVLNSGNFDGGWRQFRKTFVGEDGR